MNHNIAFESGLPAWADNASENIFVGGLRPLDGTEVIGNHSYKSNSERGECIRIGYWEQDNRNITFTDNYMIGGYRTNSMRYLENVTANNNVFYNEDFMLVDIYEAGEDLSTWDWDNNTYYYSGNRTTYMDALSWSDWQSAYEFDANSQIIYSAPSTTTYHLRHYPGNEWASLVIYDWERLNSVPVDLSSVLPIGSEYYIYDVQNIIGDPVASGTYNGGTVSVPTNLTEVEPIVGIDVANPIVHTPQDFNAYIVIAKSKKFSTALPPPVKSSISFISVTPNPVSNYLFIDMSDDLSAQGRISLYNQLGVKVYERPITKKNEMVYASGFSKGIYYLVVQIDNSEIFTQKVLILK